MAKLGVGYGVFDSVELLKASIEAIKPHIDFVSVAYQTISNYNNKCDENLVPYLTHLKDIGLIDEMFEFTPNIVENRLDQNCHLLEYQKRLILQTNLWKNGCTHFLSMDCDEMYDTQLFGNAKNYIVDNDFDTSAVSIQDYHVKPIYRINGLADYFVPFIHAITVNPAMGIEFFKYVDPTRRVNGYIKPVLIQPQGIVMHHMTNIRLDLRTKFNNSSAKVNFKDIDVKVYNLINFNPFGINCDKKIDVVDDYFKVDESIDYYKKFVENRKND